MNSSMSPDPLDIEAETAALGALWVEDDQGLPEAAGAA